MHWFRVKIESTRIAFALRMVVITSIRSDAFSFWNFRRGFELTLTSNCPSSCHEKETVCEALCNCCRQFSDKNDRK